MPAEAISEAAARGIGEFRNVLYRSCLSRRDYSFTFSYDGAGWCVYINNSPNYGTRSASSGATHRLGLGSGRPYICWSADGSGRHTPIATLSAAQGVAALWADCTDQYRATGRFEVPSGRPPVQDRSALGDRSLVGGPTQPASFRGGEARRPILAPRRDPVPAHHDWYEDYGLRAWGGGLTTLVAFSALTISAIPAGFGPAVLALFLIAVVAGVWTAYWAGGHLAARPLVAVLGGVSALLALWSLIGLPPVAWLMWVVAVLVNAGRYALAAYENEEPGL